MKGLWFAFTALVLVLIGVVYVLYQDIRRINSDLVQISRTTQELFAENNLLRQRVLSIESALKDVKAARKSGAVCDTKIPGGLYQLKTRERLIKRVFSSEQGRGARRKFVNML